MKHGPKVTSNELQVGDVVRNLHGWPKPECGNPEDFRQGYDAMTVVRADADTVDLRRPYVHVWDGIAESGVEAVNNVPRSKDRFYELLSYHAALSARR